MDCSVLESSGERSGNCDIDVDECASLPCTHESSCTDSTTSSSDSGTISIDAFSCACISGFANGVCVYDFIDEVVSDRATCILPCSAL